MVFRKHYDSGPADLLFNGKPTSVKGLQVIVDSGSSYTYFNPNAYQAILNTVSAHIFMHFFVQVIYLGLI